EPDAGCAGQGTGEARPSRRALRRRLQHLRAQSTRGRTGDGRDRTVPRKAPQAQGQQGQERGRQAERPQVPGLQLYKRAAAATARRRPGPGGKNCQQPTGPLAAQQQPRAQHGFANCSLRFARSGFHRGTAACIIRRTAVYGPVRTVVWEGRSRETPPYPDCAHKSRYLLMKSRAAVLLFALAVYPAAAQTTSQRPLIEQIRPGVTYEDCVIRCKKCGSGKN